jgi:hypothetical protein
MYISLYLPKVRVLGHCDYASVGPCGSSVGPSEIAIVGVGDNHAREKGQDRLYRTKVVRQTPERAKGCTALLLFRLTRYHYKCRLWIGNLDSLRLSFLTECSCD